MSSKKHIKTAQNRRNKLITFLQGKTKVNFKDLQAFIMKTWNQDGVQASSTLNKLKTNYPEIFEGKNILKPTVAELGEDSISVFAKNNKDDLIEAAKLRYEQKVKGINSPDVETIEEFAKRKKVPVGTVEKANILIVPDKYKIKGSPTLDVDKDARYQETIDELAKNNPKKYKDKKYSDLDELTQQSVRASRHLYQKGSDRFTPATITIDGKKQVVRIKGLTQTIADQITDGLKGIKKWAKNPTVNNWFKIFPSTISAAEGSLDAFSKDLRKYLRGDFTPKRKDTKDPTKTKIFNELNIKKIIGTPVVNKINKNVSPQNVNRYKGVLGSDISAKQYKGTDDYAEIIKTINNYEWDNSKSANDNTKQIFKLLKNNSIIKNRFKEMGETLNNQNLLKRLTNAQSGITGMERFGYGSTKGKPFDDFSVTELQTFLNKGQKWFPYAMNRALSTTLGQYLKGDELKAAKKKHRAYMDLSRYLSDEFGVKGVKGKAFLQMDHPISLRALENTKNFGGALRVNPIVGDINQWKGKIELKLGQALKKKDANQIKNLNLLTRGLFGSKAGDYTYGDKGFKVKSFGAQDFRDIDVIKGLKQNIGLRDEVIANFDSIDDEIWEQAGFKNKETLREKLMGTQDIDPAKFKNTILAWTKQNPKWTQLLKSQIGCLRKAAADGGRIGFQEGGVGDPTDVCLIQKLDEKPNMVARAFQALPKAARFGVIGAGIAGAGAITLGALTYNKELGEFVNPLNDDKAGQGTLTEWIKENPVKTVAGTSLGFSAQEIPGAYKKARELGRGRTRSALGITGALKPVLTTFGTPAMTALFEVPFSAKRLEEGETMTDILTDPLGPALGLTFMEPLSRSAGVIRGGAAPGIMGGIKRAFNPFDLSNVGSARPGLTSKILRMGLSPKVIAGISRGGLYGLLAAGVLSAGKFGLDQYDKYQNEEGMLYNLLNE